MTSAYSTSAEYPGADCPVPFDTLGEIYRSDPTSLAEIVDTIPEATRARLAIYLFSRSHTRGIARTIAATCEAGRLAASPAWPETKRTQLKRCA